MKTTNFKKVVGVFSLTLLPALVAGATASGMNGTVSSSIKSLNETISSFRADYDSMSDVEDAASELNIQLAGEGSVLLKNHNNALPIQKTTKITVLGEQADCYATGGSGSGGQTKPAGDNTPDNPYTIFEALTKEGFTYNQAVKTAYEAESANPGTLAVSSNPYENGHYMEEVPTATSDTVDFGGKHYASLSDSDTTATLKDSDLTGYKDGAALIVISRTGAESQDNEAYGLKGAENESDNYSSLNKGERELIAYAKKNFSKVILLINSPSPMELADAENDDDVDSILWIGQTGWNGILAMPQILDGTINPSGRTSDIYEASAETNPTWYNFGDYRQSNYILNGSATDSVVTGGSSIKMGYDAADTLSGYSNSNNAVVDYTESIYMGYRYYETVYDELKAVSKDKADAWYKGAVTYPYGYGLSYTTFSQTIESIDRTSITGKDDTVTVKVKVTNTGSVAGKEVVQLYNTAPYEEEGIEKASATLVGFEKTKMLAPGASETVSITVKAKDLSSFDYNDVNADDHQGYELEEGSYILSVRKNSHEILDSRTVTVSSTLSWDGDSDDSTPNAIFSQEEGKWEQFNTSSDFWAKGTNNDHYLHRYELLTESNNVALEETWSAGNPNALQKKLGWMIADNHTSNVYKAEAHHYINSQEDDTAYNDYDDRLTVEVETDYENVWVKTNDDIPSNWTQGTGTLNDAGTYNITLPEMKGVDFNDTKWDEFMNQLSWSEIAKVCQDGGYGSDEITSIDKPRMETHDGPGQMRKTAITAPDGNGYAWVCEAVIGSTWNKELAQKQGVIEGNESIFLGVTGWYAPGSNLHRSPLSGRNFEYYSSDPVQAGWMLTNVIKGYQSKGGTVYMKHMFLNDQETSRGGIATFATEQSIRELYAKSFEIAVENCDNSNLGIMTSFNRIGLQSSVSYAIQQQLYTTEWGYKGMSVTDAYTTGSGWDSENMLRGYTIPLNSVFAIFPPATLIEGEWDSSLRNGKGGVKVAAARNNATVSTTSATVESPTQYYYARQTAKRALYVYSNSNGMSDLTSKLMLSPKNLYFATSKDLNGEVVYSTSELSNFKTAMNSIFGDVGYDVEVTGLPKGVTLDLETGKLTGTAPSTAGYYDYTITARGKGKLSYITKTITNVMNITASVKSNTDISITPKMPVEITDDNFQAYEGEGDVPLSWASFMVAGQYAGKIVKNSYSATGLPEGLTIDSETGVISGKITGSNYKNGEKIPVTVTQTYISSDDIVFMTGYIFVEHTVTTTVYLEYHDDTESVSNITNTKDSSGNTVVTITFADGSTKTYTIPKEADSGSSSSTTTPVTITNITDDGSVVTITMSDGSTKTYTITKKEETKKSGCGGSVIAATSAILSLGLLGTALALKKKKEDK